MFLAPAGRCVRELHFVEDDDSDVVWVATGLLEASLHGGDSVGVRYCVVPAERLATSLLESVPRDAMCYFFDGAEGESIASISVDITVDYHLFS